VLHIEVVSFSNLGRAQGVLHGVFSFSTRSFLLRGNLLGLGPLFSLVLVLLNDHAFRGRALQAFLRVLLVLKQNKAVATRLVRDVKRYFTRLDGTVALLEKCLQLFGAHLSLQFLHVDRRLVDLGFSAEQLGVKGQGAGPLARLGVHLKVLKVLFRDIELLSRLQLQGCGIEGRLGVSVDLKVLDLVNAAAFEEFEDLDGDVLVSRQVVQV